MYDEHRGQQHRAPILCSASHRIFVEYKEDRRITGCLLFALLSSPVHPPAIPREFSSDACQVYSGTCEAVHSTRRIEQTLSTSSRISPALPLPRAPFSFISLSPPFTLAAPSVFAIFFTWFDPLQYGQWQQTGNPLHSHRRPQLDPCNPRRQR